MAPADQDVRDSKKDRPATGNAPGPVADPWVSTE